VRRQFAIDRAQMNMRESRPSGRGFRALGKITNGQERSFNYK